jgi:YihY family inner membrane protein
MSLTDRLDGFQRRHPGAGFPIAVLYKYFDDSGGYLAALITYYGFLSLFPLLLLASTFLGFVLSGDPSAQQAILHSALSQFPVIGDQLKQPGRIGGGLTGVLVGGLGALYGGLGVAMAAQNAMNIAWTVPKNNRPNPIKGRGRALLLLATVGLAVLGTTVLSALGSGAGPFGAGLRVVALVASVLLNTLVFILAFRIATTRVLTARQVAPGAVTAAVIWQLLQSFGATYVSHVVKGASATNSVFALVLGLISFIYLASVAVVLCVEINVVRVDQLWPRALLTPMTDNVDLTSGDERAYTDQAKAQRNKGFQEIDVQYRK